MKDLLLGYSNDFNEEIFLRQLLEIAIMNEICVNLIVNILRYLSTDNLLDMQRVCLKWLLIIRNNNNIWMERIQTKYLVNRLPNKDYYYNLYTKNPIVRNDNVYFQHDEFYYVGHKIPLYYMIYNITSSRTYTVYSAKKIKFSYDEIMDSFNTSDHNKVFINKSDALRYVFSKSKNDYTYPLFVVKFKYRYNKDKKVSKDKITYLEINKNEITIKYSLINGFRFNIEEMVNNRRDNLNKICRTM